jgi:hypothetical protein
MMPSGAWVSSIPNDFVWIFAGGTPPNDFLRKIGVAFGMQDMILEAGNEARQVADSKKQYAGVSWSFGAIPFSTPRNSSFNESQMARSSECTEQYAQEVFDSADIVKDAMFRQQPQDSANMRHLARPSPSLVANVTDTEAWSRHNFARSLGEFFLVPTCSAILERT